MPSDADYAAMAVGRGSRDPRHVALVQEEIEREQAESHRRACSNPWCQQCYGPVPRLAGDGNYSP